MEKNRRNPPITSLSSWQVRIYIGITFMNQSQDCDSAYNVILVSLRSGKPRPKWKNDFINPFIQTA
jgi:hypothetical protein